MQDIKRTDAKNRDHVGYDDPQNISYLHPIGKRNSLNHKEVRFYPIDMQLSMLGIDKASFETFYQFITEHKKMPEIGYVPALDREAICLFLGEYKILADGKIRESALNDFQKRRLEEMLHEE